MPSGQFGAVQRITYCIRKGIIFRRFSSLFWGVYPGSSGSLKRCAMT